MDVNGKKPMRSRWFESGLRRTTLTTSARSRRVCAELQNRVDVNPPSVDDGEIQAEGYNMLLNELRKLDGRAESRYSRPRPLTSRRCSGGSQTN